jgi:hypothetical protein
VLSFLRMRHALLIFDRWLVLCSLYRGSWNQVQELSC